MDRVPAIADLDLVTLEPPQQRIVFRGLGARLRSLFSRAGRTEGVKP